MKLKSILFLLLCSACVPELEDCDSKADVLDGVWIVKRVFVDGIEQDEKIYTNYRLALYGEGNYERTQPNGLPDSGTWLLANGETQFVLQPKISPEEAYVFESFNLRELVLTLNRASIKAGPSQIRYVLIQQ